MQTTNNKRFYSPQFSEMASVSVRRLAWALNGSMVQAVDDLISFLPQLLDVSKVCLACKDNTRCAACVFSDAPPSALTSLING